MSDLYSALGIIGLLVAFICYVHQTGADLSREHDDLMRRMDRLGITSKDATPVYVYPLPKAQTVRRK